LYHPENEALRVATVQYGNFAYSLTEWNEQPEWNDFTFGIDSEDRKGWDSPIMFHPANPGTAWCATQRVYKMEDAPFGEWLPVSDDLTQGMDPGLGFRVVTTLSGSPFYDGVVAAGTSDGQVWYTQNGGQTWNLMIEGLPERQVTDVAFDPFHADSLTVTLNGYKDAVYTPHVFRAAIGGVWQDVTGDLPNHPINDWRALNDSTWVLATDFGVYHSEDWGHHWERVGDMPFIPVFELDVDTAGSQLVAATFARSIQSFPLDSLVPAPVVTEPKDTTSIGVTEAIGLGDCFQLINHPFDHIGSVDVQLEWVGGSWSVWSSVGEMMSSGKINAPRLSWSMNSWTPGIYVIRIESPGGKQCSQMMVKVATSR